MSTTLSKMLRLLAIPLLMLAIFAQPAFAMLPRPAANPLPVVAQPVQGAETVQWRHRNGYTYYPRGAFRGWRPDNNRRWYGYRDDRRYYQPRWGGYHNYGGYYRNRGWSNGWNRGYRPYYPYGHRYGYRW